MKILVISGAYPPYPSPESYHTLLLCEQFAARGIEVDLLTHELGPGFPAPQGFGLHPMMKSWSWSQFPTLLRCIRRLRPDAILLIYIDWIYQCEPMITFAPALLRWLQPFRPFVTQFENESGLTWMRPPNGNKSRLARALLSWLIGRRGLHPTYGSLLRDSSRIIALCKRHLEAFEQAHPGVGSKAEVIPAPAAMHCEAKSDSARQRGRAMLGLSEQDVVLVYFGFLYFQKGIETLLTAFASLPRNTRLVIVGGSTDVGYVARLRELSRLAGRAEQVLWLGHSEDESASFYLHAADICVLPFNDGVQLNNSSFAVAASHGLPIVTTCGESLEAPFVDGENVCLCPPKDPAALAAAIIELMNSPEACFRLAAGARKLAENLFSWDHVIQSTLRSLGSPVTLVQPGSSDPAMSANL